MAASETMESQCLTLVGKDETGEEYEASEEFRSLQDKREWYKTLNDCPSLPIKGS